MEEHRLTQLTSGGTPFSRGAPLIPRHAGPSASPPTRLLSLPMCAYHSPSRWCGEDWGMALSYSHHPDAFPARPNAPASPGTPSAPSHRAHRRLWLHLIAAASTASLGIAARRQRRCGVLACGWGWSRAADASCDVGRSGTGGRSCFGREKVPNCTPSPCYRPARKLCIAVRPDACAFVRASKGVWSGSFPTIF